MIDPVDVRASFNPLLRTWWRLTRSMTLGVRVIAADEAGRVALVRHSYGHGWHLPGGGVERGETAEQAALREAREESGVMISSLTLFGLYSNHAHFRGDHVIVFRALEWSHTEPDGGSEIAERGWFALDDLPEAIKPGARRRLEEAFEAREISPHW